MTRKAIIIETGGTAEVEQVGENLWLDKTTKEIYRTEELKFADDLTKDMLSAILIKGSMDDMMDSKNRLYDFRTDLALTIISRRPFISPEKLERLIDKITKSTLK